MNTIMNKQKIKNNLLKSSIGRTVWRWMHYANISLLSIQSDLQYFTRVYTKTHGEKPDFENPKTFDEKQLWLKMHYRNPLCTQCSDKYMVREYVKACGYGHILNQLYGVYDSVEDIQWDELPERFYLKVNHMSGCNVRCESKESFDIESAKKKLKIGLRHDYSKDSREWNYKNIDRKIIAEAIIESKDKKPLIDYRFLCCAGVCNYVFIDIGTAGENGEHLEDAKRNVYDKDMNLLDIKVSRERFDPILVSKPSNWYEMLECAEKLSKPFPFCRVDLYSIDDAIVFGEITFFHAGGLSQIEPKEWDIRLGKDISIEFAQEQIENGYCAITKTK